MTVQYELSAKARVLQIMQEILRDYPPQGWMEKMAVSEFTNRLNNLSETQCKGIIERVRQRLT